MNAPRSRNAAPGPNALGAAAFIASAVRSPLDAYVRLAARYADTIGVPYAPGWPDPAGFDPRRFLPVGSTEPGHDNGQLRHRYAYVPFGGGRRACVGASFAELETVLVLATIARRYRLELTMSGIPVPSANITLRPGRSLPMRLLCRK